MYILIKPNANQYSERIIEHFKTNLKGKIIDTYTVKLSDGDRKARKFLQSLTHNQEEKEKLELYEKDWLSELKVFQVAKVAARIEIMNILEDSSFEIESLYNVRMPLKNDDLDLLLFPVWNAVAENQL